MINMYAEPEGGRTEHREHLGLVQSQDVSWPCEEHCGWDGSSKLSPFGVRKPDLFNPHYLLVFGYKLSQGMRGM